MSNKEMSIKEDTLQLPPQFPSISCERESETEYSSFKKRGKHHKENEVPLKKRKMKSLNVEVWLFHFFQSSLVDKTLPRDFDGDLECFIFLRTA